MPELLPSERLRPCLIDRITDSQPGKRTEGRDQRVMTMQKYRQAVLRDLSWLLNCSNRDPIKDLEGFEEIHKSVLNFGIPDLTGVSASSVDSTEVAFRITEAIRLFEPRIIPASLKVTVLSRQDEFSSNAVSFRIEGELWAQPFHEMLLIKTDVDLETGNFSIQEVSH